MPRQVSLEGAVAQIQPQQRVLVPPACGLPQALVAELGRQASRFNRLEVMGGFLIGSAPYVDEAYADHFHYRTIHPAGEAGKAVRRGQASYVPLRYHETLRAFSAAGTLAADVVLVQVAPPDGRGRYSLGVSPSYSLPLAKQAPCVIAQVNEQMPRTLGDAFLEAHEIDFAVQHSEPLREYPAAHGGALEARIADHIESLIDDGCTIQTGLGSIPEALLPRLASRRDLRLHSLLVPSARSLFESGAVRGRPSDSSVCEIMGDTALFQFAHENPGVHMDHSGTVHDPLKIARIPRFVSVLSALEVDLSGQVNAEAVGSRPVAGIGGQLDFAMGAALSDDAVCIIAMPSHGGRQADRSRIVASLGPHAPVTTPRSLVQFVVTEHGLADLRGKSLEQRRSALIDIAAPEFRGALAAARE